MDFKSLFLWWQETVRNAFEVYGQYGRSILDALHVVFDSLFNAILVITILISAVFLLLALYTAFKKKEAEQAVDERYTPSVTVQIPTYNEPVAIRCAQACLEFDYPAEKVEILIGDDSNNSTVSKKLAEFASSYERVSIIKRGHNEGYKPGNLNSMLQHSNGEIIVIFDSDFVPGKDFLKRIVQPFKGDEKIAAAQAKWSFVNERENMITVLGSTILNVYHYITLPFLRRRRNISFLCGSAEAVRASTLRSLGGWNAGNLTEDIEYSIRLINSGYRIVYLEDLRCDSEVPYTAKDLYRQQMRWGYGVISSFKRHFRQIFKSRENSFEDKFCMGVVCSGYLLAFLLFALFTTGFLSIATHAPEPIDWGKFFFELGRNVALTSGLLVSSIIALKRSRNMRSLPSMIASSFSYGIVMTYHVNKGIFKAVLGRPMEWFMLQKKGNEAFE